ncbi:MBL fold metallo-hydrolase [Halorubrum sp. SD683]|nr:MBL fold metallo-hydrolase [Halorubrum sp. SD683]
MSTPTGASVQLIRHATLLVDVGDTTFLVDPMFSAPGDNPPIPNTPNDRRNPLVVMPDVEVAYDAVVVTHRHTDHFDEAAKTELDADVPLVCQPEEAETFLEEGFTDVRPVDEEASFAEVTIHRTPGRHGHDEFAEEMGPVSGFVFEADQTVYVAGDTIWYEPVAEALERFDPEVVVLNGGEARFEQGAPITMGIDDISAARQATDATVVVVHMEAINHCLLSREEVRSAVADVHVPEDGAEIGLYVEEKRKMSDRPVRTSQDEFATAGLPPGDGEEPIVAGAVDAEPDRDPHEVLSVAQDAREESIRGAYRELVKAAHGDQGDDRDLDVQELQEARDAMLED